LNHNTGLPKPVLHSALTTIVFKFQRKPAHPAFTFHQAHTVSDLSILFRLPAGIKLHTEKVS